MDRIWMRRALGLVAPSFLVGYALSMPVCPAQATVLVLQFDLQFISDNSVVQPVEYAMRIWMGAYLVARLHAPATKFLVGCLLSRVNAGGLFEYSCPEWDDRRYVDRVFQRIVHLCGVPGIQPRTAVPDFL